MTHRVGAKGQVVIPKELRERAGLRPGVEVDFDLQGDQIVLSALVKRGSALKGRFVGSGMASRLIDDRAKEPR